MKLLNWIFTRRYNIFDMAAMTIMLHALHTGYFGLFGATLWIIASAAVSVIFERLLNSIKENHNEH